jgi:NTE family protein
MAIKPHIPLVMIALFIGMMATSIMAQEVPRNKVGLVLSGGGARGLAHIGVIKVLEEVGMPIDMVGGTSMGAIVGGLYASGYSAAQLENIALTTRWMELFTDETSRRYIPIEEKSEDSKYMLNLPMRGFNVGLPSGLVSGQEAFKTLAGLTWHVQHIQQFDELPIPFVCVATDLETGEAVLIRSGSLAEAMRASMTLPSIFTPAMIQGRPVLDGGISNNFPVMEVLEMGADVVIGVDVSSLLPKAEYLNSMLDILNQTVSFQIERTAILQRERAGILFQPTLEPYGLMSFNDTRAIIDAGEAIARSRIDELRALADSLNALGRPNRVMTYAHPDGHPIVLREIVYQGLNQADPRMIDAELQTQLPLNTELTRGDVNLAIDRLFSLKFFEQVTYQIEPVRSGYRLILHIKEITHDQFRVGLRYDNRENAALLFNNTYKNVFLASSTLRVSLRLGELTSLEGQYYTYLRTTPKLGANLRVRYAQNALQQYRSDVNLGTLSTNLFMTEFWTGPVMSSMLQSGIGFRLEAYESRSVSGTVRSPTRGVKSNNIPFAFLILDTANDAHFPTNGQFIHVRADFGSPLHQTKRYERYEAIWKNHIPVQSDLTLNVVFRAGASNGRLPSYRAFYLGDMETLHGFQRDEINGTSYRSAQASLQIRVADNRFVSLVVNGVSSNGFWGTSEPRTPIQFGWGLGFGANTFVGPLRLALMGNNAEAIPIIYTGIGFRF